jgi:PAS domain S-box-containing protein
MQLNGESYILSSINNITERKKMEEELRNEQQFSASLIDSLPGIFYLYSYPELRLVRYNKNHEVFLGFDPDELKGLSVRDWNIQDSRMPVINAMEEAMKTGSVRIEANLNTKDGRTIPFILTGVRLDIRDKSYIMGMGIDITSLKAAEEEISIKNTELLKLNAEKDKFFSIIAHDLRSPFNALLGFTTIIAEELPSLEPDEIQKIALTLRDSAANVYNLLENLLEWSVIQIGLKSFNKEPFSLKSKIYDSSELIEVSALQKNINISSDIPDNLEMVADGNMVGTVIRNLLSNAVKFTKNGGKIKIEAKLLNENEIQISVSDTGIGLSKDRLDRLFNIHEKTNRQGTNGEHSTGLGLIICKDLIEKYGGMIWAESEVDKGSTFYVKLPAR